MINFLFNKLSMARHINWFWLFPAGLIVLVSFFSYANVDSIRDYTEALRITTGESWPLLGPQMAFSFSLGPWWFYLLSTVLLIQKSWLSIAIFTALINGLKFLFIYKIGNKLGGEKLGFLMVIALLMSSFTLMQNITFTHTNLIEAVMLLIILTTMNTHQERCATWLKYGLLLGIAFHIHPTAFLAGYFVLIRWLGVMHKGRNILALMVGLLIIFTPLVINEIWGNATLIKGSAAYLDHQINTFSLSAFFKLIVGLWVVAPYVMLKTIFSPNTALVLTAIQLLIQLVAVIAPIVIKESVDKSMRRLLLHLWIFLILFILGLILIRANTPWYMTYGVSLTSSMITAIGLYILWHHFKLQKSVILIALYLLSIFTLSHIYMIKALQDSAISVPSGSLNDIKLWDTRMSQFSYEILAHQATNHGKFTCQNQPISLHGPYSQLIYSHNGIEHKSNCQHDLNYGPGNHKNHLIGVPPQYADLIITKPIEVIGNTYFYSPVAISTTQKLVKENFQHDYEKTFKVESNWQKNLKQAELSGGKYLVITNLLGFKAPYSIKQVKLNGLNIEPIIEHYHSALYACEKCDPTNADWTVQFYEGITGSINAVSF